MQTACHGVFWAVEQRLRALPQAKGQGRCIVQGFLQFRSTDALQCDQQRPKCGKCIKLNLDCPGYRDLQQVMFRDQSAAVIRRVTKRQSPDSVRSMATQTSDDSSELTELSDTRSVSSSQDLPFSMHPSLVAQGAAFFFAQYAIFNEPPFSGTFNNWVIENYCFGDQNSSLRLAIEAVGMAGISNGYFAPNAAEKSRERYCHALSAVNKDLNDPTLAYDDSTLLAIVLLGVYEVSLTVSVRDPRWKPY